MVKKGQKKAEGKRNGENMIDLWTEFAIQMEKRLKEMFELGTEEYNDIYKSWTEISDKMTKNMIGIALGDEAVCKNIYNCWKEYSEKLNIDLSGLRNWMIKNKLSS